MLQQLHNKRIMELYKLILYHYKHFRYVWPHLNKQSGFTRRCYNINPEHLWHATLTLIKSSSCITLKLCYIKHVIFNISANLNFFSVMIMTIPILKNAILSLKEVFKVMHFFKLCFI